ncbi:MAG: hypothetical protein U9Q74_11015, partial [Gemmatimonadota bacterium]|nr:hypothetical protein [Gemmatimonadota bacterium]
MPSRAHARLAAALVLLASLGAAGGAQPGPWRALVEGSSLAAWRGYKFDSVPAGWSAEGGVLSKARPVGDIMTR